MDLPNLHIDELYTQDTEIKGAMILVVPHSHNHEAKSK